MRIRGRVLRWLIGLLLCAVAVHLLAVWALPRVIMWRLMSSGGMQAQTGVFLPPMTDASQRRVVMPSPDLLYAACVIDASTQPVRVRADPQWSSYWSIALYAANSDNFFVINDRQAAGKPVDLVIHAPAATPPALPAGTQAVAAPTDRVLLLMRLLVADYGAQRTALEAARRSLRCDPA